MDNAMRLTSSKVIYWVKCGRDRLSSYDLSEMNFFTRLGFNRPPSQFLPCEVILITLGQHYFDMVDVPYHPRRYLF
jgi:hypothetical protein